MSELIYINEEVFRLSEEYGHYIIRDFGTNKINCTCDYGELNEMLLELVEEVTSAVK